MDLPVVLDDWSWIEQPISSSVSVNALFLDRPKSPTGKRWSSSIHTVRVERQFSGFVPLMGRTGLYLKLRMNSGY